jgi:lysophospholipase
MTNFNLRNAAALVILWGAMAILAAAQEVTLTTESELKQPATAAAIESFWSSTGRSGTFEGQRGVRIAFMRFEQPQGSRQAGAIIIVSGRTESMLKYKETVRDLYRAGYSVYIHDHRGQGLSGREPETASTPEKGHVSDFQYYVDDLRKFIATQVLPAGQPKHFLLAHSMGGAIAALFLESDSIELGRMDAAVLSSPMLEIKGVAGMPADLASCDVAAKFVASGKATDYIISGEGYNPRPFESNEYTHNETRYKRLLAQVNAVPQIRLGSPTHGWFDAACKAALQARSNAGRVRLPTYVLVAGGDSIVHNDGAVEFCNGMRRAMPSANCGGREGVPFVVKDARHELLIEDDAMRDMALRHALGFFGQAARRQN